jgi:hypothetical protein
VPLYADQDATYLRSLEAERISLSGPVVEYYSLVRGQNMNNQDAALYGEPTAATPVWGFTPMFEVALAFRYVESEGRTPAVRDEGFDWDSSAEASVARDTWELVAPAGVAPKEGDVFKAFDSWWDVVSAGKGGNVLDTPTFVGYSMSAKRRSKFTPDRKVT